MTPYNIIDFIRQFIIGSYSKDFHKTSLEEI